MNKKLANALAARAGRHSYGYDPKRNVYVVHAPENIGGDEVCVLVGNPMSDNLHYRANAICKALDRELKKRQAQP